MKKNQIYFLGIFLLLMSSTLAFGYDFQYVNSRFGFSVNIPSEFTPQRESTNSDGRDFISKDGEKISAFASYNVLENTLDEEMAEDMNMKTIVYKTKKDNWYVLSWQENNIIYYVKKIFSKNTFYSLYFKYPAEQKKRFDKIIVDVAKSFTVKK